MEQPISSIRPAAGSAPLAPIRPQTSDAPRSQEVAPGASAPLQDAAVGSGKAVEPVELEDATARLNDLVQHTSKVRFEMREEDLTVQVVDSATDEVIRSIPAEKVLELRDHFRELTGLLLDDRV